MNKQIIEQFDRELNNFRTDLSNAIGCKLTEGDIEKNIKKDIAKVFNTKPLLTLKKRKQLGLLDKVKTEWENVVHTRYDHSMGVAAKSIIVCDIINKNVKKDENKLTERDIKELALAASIHDCGHLPISHAVERAFLSSGLDKNEVSHEARIIPLLLRRNKYFEDLQLLINSWVESDEDSFDSDSIYRVAYMISPDRTEAYVKDKENFIAPKKALIQLLSSEIDVDRLDYILRDADNLKYNPVTLLKNEILKFIKGLSLVNTYAIGQNIKNNVELCIKKEFLPNIFYLLVSRVLLYKNCYFSKEVRSFEAILTSLIGHFLKEEISIDPLKLVGMSDDYFIDNYLDELADDILKVKDKDHLKKKYINVLKETKSERFSLQLYIEKDKISNPSLRLDLENNINKHSYIDAVKNEIINLSENEISRNDILIDVFNLKTGGGKLLVENCTNKNDYSTLNDHMNGSNMHKLCSESRLDIYYKSDISDIKKEKIKNIIIKFFEYDKKQ